MLTSVLFVACTVVNGKNPKYLLYSSTHYKSFWEEASVQERRYFIIPLGKLGTYTIATTVLSNHVTITSLIRSGQSDVSRTFWDILIRSLIGQNCEEHTVPPHASTLHLSCLLCAETMHPLLDFARQFKPLESTQWFKVNILHYSSLSNIAEPFVCDKNVF